MAGAEGDPESVFHKPVAHSQQVALGHWASVWHRSLPSGWLASDEPLGQATAPMSGSCLASLPMGGE